MPLPIWFAMILLLGLFLASRRHHKYNADPSTASLRSRLHTATLVLYYVLIVCNILMQTLEMVRLLLIAFGVGLLPFVYVGLLIGGVLHWTKGVHGRVRHWHAVNSVIWFGGTIVSIVKIAGLVKMGINGRKASKYPVSDQVIDLATMAGVYVVIGLLEVVLGIWSKGRVINYKSLLNSTHRSS